MYFSFVSLYPWLLTLKKKSLKQKECHQNILKDLFLRQFNKVRGLSTLRLMNESTLSLLEHITFTQTFSNQMNKLGYNKFLWNGQYMFVITRFVLFTLFSLRKAWF